MMTDNQINKLADYILAHCPSEIGPSDGAVSVATRLMGRMAEGIKSALNELGVPGKNYPAPVANAVEVLCECRT